MTTSTFSSVNEKQVWETNFTSDFHRRSGFMKFIGQGNGSVIRVKKNLMNEGGALIHLPMIPKLVGAGVTGSTLLRNNEEKQRNWSFAIRTSMAGNAVTVNEAETFRSELDLLDAAKPGLLDWAARRSRDLMVSQLQSIVVRGTYGDAAGNDQTVEDTTVLYASATEAQKDAFLDNNSDRIVFADTTNIKSRALSTSAPAGGATNDHSATLLTVTSADKLSAGILGVAKRKAQLTEQSTTKPSITPVSDNADSFQEDYIFFCDLPGFRDLQADLKSANIDGRPRDPSQNPYFTDGDLYVNGITIKAIPALGNLGTVGASSAVIGTGFLCGASALGLAYSKMPQARTDDYSYGQQKGVGIVMIDGYGKIAYNGAQAGVVTVYHSSIAD